MLVVQGIAKPVFVCDECDAMWVSRRAIAKSSWVDFETTMMAAGVTNPWSVATIIERNVA
jgi:hypothetical protein